MSNVHTLPRLASDITVTDQFCGAGGSSLGAARHGVRIRLALNHWERAIETHNTNFPDTDHDCTDVSAADPRRYYATDILITSPECTNHSLAKGQKKKHADQSDLFVPTTDDPAAERSRATMWDVCRFAEQWRYRIIVTENVVDARGWVMYDAWCQAMMALGYQKHECYFNSMFFWPTPQNRDRLYVVWVHKSVGRMPDLDFKPIARCLRCARDVRALQAWKNGKRAGKYDTTGKRGQYLYTCPDCRGRVEPYYYAALNAIDWSLPIERIGDRTKPLKERTRTRIARGLERYGREPIVVQVNNPSRLDSRVRPATDPVPTQASMKQHGVAIPPAMMIHTRQGSESEGRVRDARQTPLGTQTGGQDFGVAIPPAVLVDLSHASSPDARERDARTAPHPAQTACQATGVVILRPSMIVETAHHDDDDARVRDPRTSVVPSQTSRHSAALVLPPSCAITLTAGSSDSAERPVSDPLATQTGTDRFGLAVRGCVVSHQGEPGYNERGFDDALGTQLASATHQYVVLRDSAIVTLRGKAHEEYMWAELDDAVHTQVGTKQSALVSRTPHVLSYTSNPGLEPATEPMMTQATRTQHAYVELPQPTPIAVDDCYFRMLATHEIQAAMAFDHDYVITGKSKEQVKQLGNAVTPPVMEWIIGRCVEALTGDGRGAA